MMRSSSSILHRLSRRRSKKLFEAKKMSAAWEKFKDKVILAFNRALSLSQARLALNPKDFHIEWTSVGKLKLVGKYKVRSPQDLLPHALRDEPFLKEYGWSGWSHERLAQMADEVIEGWLLYAYDEALEKFDKKYRANSWGGHDENQPGRFELGFHTFRGAPLDPESEPPKI